MGLKNKMERACPSQKELAETILSLKTSVNELKADHNAYVAASSAKINELVTQVADIRTKYTAHLAIAAHPDAAPGSAVAGDEITAISTTDNKVSSADIAFE